MSASPPPLTLCPLGEAALCCLVDAPLSLEHQQRLWQLADGLARTPAAAALTAYLAGEGEGCATSLSAQKQAIPNQHRTARGKACLAAG